MLPYRHLPSARAYLSPERGLDHLAVRMRRLARHRGYVRGDLESPLLRRLMPPRAGADPVADTAELRLRLKQADLDGNVLAYLVAAVEDELLYARLRLTA